MHACMYVCMYRLNPTIIPDLSILNSLNPENLIPKVIPKPLGSSLVAGTQPNVRRRRISGMWKRITGNGESGWVRSLPDLDNMFIWSPLIILHSYGIDNPFIQVIYYYLLKIMMLHSYLKLPACIYGLRLRSTWPFGLTLVLTTFPGSCFISSLVMTLRNHHIYFLILYTLWWFVAPLTIQPF